MSALPLLLAAGAAVVLMGGKKKSTQSGDAKLEAEPKATGILTSEATPQYASWEGVRSDERGNTPWRVKQDADGFHALILDPTTQFGITDEDVGVATSEAGARMLLRDRLNELLRAEFPDATPRADPSEISSGFAQSRHHSSVGRA